MSTVLDRRSEQLTNGCRMSRSGASVSKIKNPETFCFLLMQGESDASQETLLSKIVHMPQDPDILFILWRNKRVYTSAVYASVNGRHTFEQMRVWKQILVQCQAWYFSVLLQERCYSPKELELKLEPFISQDAGRHLFAPTMLKAGKRLMTVRGKRPKIHTWSKADDSFRSLSEVSLLSVREIATAFVRYAQESDLSELESFAKQRGLEYASQFIKEVKHFFTVRERYTSVSPFIQVKQSALPSLLWPPSTILREKRRSTCASDETSTQEDWINDILNKRPLFVSTDSISCIAER
jgi:hypothetical protein